MIRTETTLRFALLLTLTNGFLDAYTFIARGGVFANVQTGNVIFFGIRVAAGDWGSALAHVWPIFAFLVGVVLASHIKSRHAAQLVAHPLRWVVAVQAGVLGIIGFVPTSVPHSLVTVPISFMAAMQVSLFRRIGDLTYLAVATTGNLMRFVESGYTGFVDRDEAARAAFRVYGSLTATFAGGAVIGALASHGMGPSAAWLPAAFLAVALGLFVVDERKSGKA